MVVEEQGDDSLLSQNHALLGRKRPLELRKGTDARGILPLGDRLYSFKI